MVFYALGRQNFISLSEVLVSIGNFQSSCRLDG
jgi:hypothetical protein